MGASAHPPLLIREMTQLEALIMTVIHGYGIWKVLSSSTCFWSTDLTCQTPGHFVFKREVPLCYTIFRKGILGPKLGLSNLLIVF